MTVDYRLLHQFRVSQRRELAARGELPTQFHVSDALVESVEEAEPARTTKPQPVPRSKITRPAVPHSASPRPERVQVLTQLLNEDR